MQAAEQAEHNLGLANSRVPPAWCVERDRTYPLRRYVRDLQLWAVATDIPEARQGPVVALRLTGAARELVCEMPVEMLTNGEDINDAQGNLVEHRSGVVCLVRALNARFGALAQEIQIWNVSELMTFSRHHHESTDEMLARYELILHQLHDA